ncbi:hypothetical protein, partial [Salmonella sp. s58408]|uniref:hypothetical protein n=1 Tax=Salmonella sp. s58408 TaxID=3159701 RepID=UPI0039811A24
PPPTDKRERSDEEYMSYLPPLSIATTQVVVLTLLGSVVHTNLGDYDSSNFDDVRVYDPLSKFQNAIEEIGFNLASDNSYIASEWRSRGKDKHEANNFCYTTLLPEKIPQSINI